jgi:hypothetical protein
MSDETLAIQGVRRWLFEIRSHATSRDGERALARVRVSHAEDSLVFGWDEAGSWLDDAKPARNVTVSRGVYGLIPTRQARVSLLCRARRLASEHVILHVPLAGEGSYLTRALVDAPRRLLGFGEPGDRFSGGAFTHHFFDEEPLLEEFALAGLRIVERKGFRFVLEAVEGQAPIEHADGFATELHRVARLLRRVDDERERHAPGAALSAMRELGRQQPTRGAIGRARLCRAIGWLDALHPAGPNCYRRVLLESALDAGAASETVVFGLNVASTGHVAFEGREERAFDVSFRIAPETR